MNIHFIAIGGSVMHNLALALAHSGHRITGSDDEIYNPARERLARFGLLPDKMGWLPERIHAGLDAVILGMHARTDNPELKKAAELGLTIYSFPEFIFQNAKNKRRVVVAGSHGKTTTTAMIMHVLKFHDKDFDYLVGAQLKGFETMVRLSDAPLIIIEGDEYLSSAIDPRPKFLHYRPDIAVITGIAWDHINVFPTFEEYVNQFKALINELDKGSLLIWCKNDPHLKKILRRSNSSSRTIPYEGMEFSVVDGKTQVVLPENSRITIPIFGRHNLENLQAAFHVCLEIGISQVDFFKAIQSFEGAAWRLQLIGEGKNSALYKDFAHAPSKARATVQAVKDQFPERRLIACLELHTYSSLNKNFLPHYARTLNAADEAVVFFSEHTFRMKKLPPFTKKEAEAAFAHPNIRAFDKAAELRRYLEDLNLENANLLLMSSGTFGGLDIPKLADKLII